MPGMWLKDTHQQYIKNYERLTQLWVSDKKFEQL